MTYTINKTPTQSFLKVTHFDYEIEVTIKSDLELSYSHNGNKKVFVFNKTIIGFGYFITEFLDQFNSFYDSEMKPDLDFILTFLTNSISH